MSVEYCPPMWYAEVRAESCFGFIWAENSAVCWASWPGALARQVAVRAWRAVCACQFNAERDIGTRAQFVNVKDLIKLEWACLELACLAQSSPGGLNRSLQYLCAAPWSCLQSGDLSWWVVCVASAGFLFFFFFNGPEGIQLKGAISQVNQREKLCAKSLWHSLVKLLFRRF